MAKIVHNNIIDTINDIAFQAKQREVVHLNFDSDVWTGRHITLNNRQLINFGTCGYLGLETHPKLIERARDYAGRYGTQFSISRAYVTSKTNIDLEEKLSQVFDNHKTIVFSSTTLTHIAILPIVVNPEDAIILDQQAHVSMQTAAQLMAPKGVPIEIIRHSNLDMLERQIQSLRDKHSRIWYVIDGVYSMYGDIAPVEKLNELAKKYSQLHFYVDDAHGMSWTGKNGSGCVFETLKKNGKTILVTTMAKGFGSIGGVVVFPHGHWYDRVILHGGPLAYSHPIAPAVLGASIASAEIHLSNEVVQLQHELDLKLKYCTALLEKSNLPILSDPSTPIFFIGTGQPNVGYNFNKRILDEGFYVNIGMFPAVPVKNTGLRFTVTNHVSLKEIEAFVDALKYHYPKALEEGGKTVDDVRKAFRMSVKSTMPADIITPTVNLAVSHSTGIDKYKRGNEFKVVIESTINKVDHVMWDKIFHDKGNFDSNSLRMMEDAFSNNAHQGQNWKFRYILIYDKQENLVLATHLTVGLFKDDLLSREDISIQVEEQRKNDPYYLTSISLTLGSIFSEGEHLYVDRTNLKWKDAVVQMLDTISAIQEIEEANNVILRDFEDDEYELAEIFAELGFVKIQMPNSNVIENLEKTIELHYNKLNGKNRKHLRDDVFRYRDSFNIEIKDNLSPEELAEAFNLYQNVANKNFTLNIFKYPYKLIEEINANSNWEFVCLYNKEKLVAIGCCYKSSSSYCAVLLGMDYEVNHELKVYKQILFQVTKRAIQLEKTNLQLGLSADLEKRKIGASSKAKFAFANFNDIFNLEILESMSAVH